MPTLSFITGSRYTYLGNHTHHWHRGSNYWMFYRPDCIGMGCRDCKNCHNARRKIKLESITKTLVVTLRFSWLEMSNLELGPCHSRKVTYVVMSGNAVPDHHYLHWDQWLSLMKLCPRVRCVMWTLCHVIRGYNMQSQQIPKRFLQDSNIQHKCAKMVYTGEDLHFYYQIQSTLDGSRDRRKQNVQ